MLSYCRNNWFYFSVVAFVFIAAVCYGFTIRPGADWAEDYALYILHGLNIANGQNYGYLVMADLELGRVFSYPPGLPIILAFSYLTFGLNFLAFKWVEILFLLSFLAFITLYINKYRIESSIGALMLMVMIAANPFVWLSKDFILSDLPFLFICFLSLGLYHALCDSNRPPSRARYFVMAVLSFALVAGYATRTVGITVPIAIFVFEVLRYRKLRISTIIILIPFALYFLGSIVLVGSFSGYMQDTLATSTTSSIGQNTSTLLDFDRLLTKANKLLDFDRLIAKANNFRYALAKFVTINSTPNSIPMADAAIFYVLLVVPATIGYGARVIRRISVLEIFAPIYVGIHMVAHIATYPRYMLPLFVLLLIYAVEGIEAVASRIKIAAIYPITFLFVALISINLVHYVYWNPPNFDDGIDHPSAQHLFKWIKQNTEIDDVLVSRKANILRLMTERKVGKFGTCGSRQPCYYSDRQDWIWNYLRGVKAKYIVLKKTNWASTHYLSDYLLEELFIESNKDRFLVAFENNDFKIYRIVTLPAN